MFPSRSPVFFLGNRSPSVSKSLEIPFSVHRRVRLPQTVYRCYSEVATQAKPTPLLWNFKDYADLSKIRLGSLVLASAAFGYYMGPGMFSGMDMAGLLCGTGLAICSANALNQSMEPHRDALMTRTQKRPIPQGRLTSSQALRFSLVTGVLLLDATVNAPAALVALGTIGLYGSYTALKFQHSSHTLLGALVGALPPVIGWAAAGGTFNLGATALGYLLFTWQFPHFFALAASHHAQYSQGGYKMLPPLQLGRYSLLGALGLLPVGAFASFVGLTDSLFAWDSLLPGLGMTYLAVQFWRNPKESKNLFFGSLLYLVALMTLMALHKRSDHSTPLLD